MASNIAAGSVTQITALMKVGGLIPELVQFARQGSWEIRQDAIYALANIFVFGSDDHVIALVQEEGLGPIAKVLSSSNVQPSLLCAALDAVDSALGVSHRHSFCYESVLEEYEGLDFLESLQEHRSNLVYEKCIGIVKNYFQDNDAEDENLAPKRTTNGAFRFGAQSPKGPSTISRFPFFANRMVE